MLDAAICEMDGAPKEELNNALSKLIGVLDASDPYCGGVGAMAIGAMLEFGADAKLASVPLRKAVARRMREASAFSATWGDGKPLPSDVDHVEPFDATINQESVEPKELQAWAARDPKNARTWSRMDDWFLPIMALARMDQAGRQEIVGDKELREAYFQLKENDPAMFIGRGFGNSNAGCHFENLIVLNKMPMFDDEMVEPDEPEGTTKIFDDIASVFDVQCHPPDVVVRVKMDFTQSSPSVSVIRHVRNPEKLFDTSEDTPFPLTQAEQTRLEDLARRYYELMPTDQTTVSVYADGSWSFGSTRNKPVNFRLA